MKIYYHKEPGGNFGDDLNLLLWPKLLPGLIDGQVIHDPLEREGEVQPGEKLLIGIGTLLNRRIPPFAEKHVFGAGAGYGYIPEIDRTWRLHFVRGPRTAKMLNLDRSLAITDPALLVNTLQLRPTEKRFRYSFVPHCASARNDGWKIACEKAGMNYIDPRQSPEVVIEKIGQTEMLITEALHGSIIAESLRVPWIPVRSGQQVLQTKWDDWCETIGISYDPIPIPGIWRADGLPRRMVRAAKIEFGARLLTRIARTRAPLQAKDARISELIDRMQEKLRALIAEMQK